MMFKRVREVSIDLGNIALKGAMIKDDGNVVLKTIPNKISTDTSIPPDDSDIKVTITATDWHEVSKKYDYENKNDIPLLNYIHDY